MGSVRFIGVVACLVTASAARADVITYNLTVNQSVYNVGDTVVWIASVNASDYSANNFGTAGLQFDLIESRGELLTPATIAAPFSDYTLQFVGIPGAGTLANASAGQFTFNAAIVEEQPPGDGVFTPLATGSFTATALGSHTLTLVPDPDPGTNNYFADMANLRVDYSSVFGSFTTFQVVAIPDPSAAWLLAAAMSPLSLHRRLRRRLGSCVGGAFQHS